VTGSTLDIAPRALITERGTVSNAALPHIAPTDPLMVGLVNRAGQSNYWQWLDHVQAAAGCTRPVRLQGDIYDVRRTADSATVFGVGSTATMPDGVIYKACGNRRESVCPACAKTYQRDAFQLIRAGLIGGKGIPATVSQHPAVFATFTAPSFGTVHNRVVKQHTCTNRKRCDCRPEPCHARRGMPSCEHARDAYCFARHEASDLRLGKPICLDCYDHAHHVVWNRYAGELWRRTKQAIDRSLSRIARQRGIARVVIGYNTKTGNPITASPVRASCGKAGEYQTRAVVHFHVLIRLDGFNPINPDAIIAPPAGLTAEDLHDAIRAAATEIRFTTPGHPDKPEGWLIEWGEQVDVRTVVMSGNGEVTDSMVAGYLAKYTTKSTEVTGHRSTRLDPGNVYDYANFGGDHIQRLIAACWRLGRRLGKLPINLTPRRIPGLVPAYVCKTCGQRTLVECCEGCNPPGDNPPQQPAKTDSDKPAPPHEPGYYRGLQRWAHMLGFGGHVFTKTRRYSITFKYLRDTRVIFRRNEIQPVELDREDLDRDGEETTLVLSTLTFAGIGWHTSADAMLANTSAALAREHRQIVREELEHQIAMRRQNTNQ
jgi:hypothetical protein